MEILDKFPIATSISHNFVSEAFHLLVLCSYEWRELEVLLYFLGSKDVLLVSLL